MVRGDGLDLVIVYFVVPGVGSGIVEPPCKMR